MTYGTEIKNAHQTTHRTLTPTRTSYPHPALQHPRARAPHHVLSQLAHKHHALPHPICQRFFLSAALTRERDWNLTLRHV